MKYFTILVLLSSQILFSQNIIQGYVVDAETNTVLENANTIILETSEGTATDAFGYFEITTARQFPVTLLVSYIGYTPYQFTVSNDSTLLIELNPVPVMGAAVSVVGTRSRADRDVAVAFETLDIEQMERSGAHDLSDALRTVSSVVIDQAEAGIQTISIRGSNSNEVAVFLDGIRLNDANTGVANLAAIDQNDLSKVEVVKGGGTTLFGSGAFGGVLNLTTQAPDSTSFKFSRGLGLLDDENQDLSASLTGRLGIVGFGGRYSGKARRYYGRSLYTTLFQNVYAAIYPRAGVLNFKAYAMEDFLKYPTGDVLQSAKTRLTMGQYSGSIFTPGDWELFVGQRLWTWHDEFYTNLNRDIKDDNLSSRIGYHISSNKFDATLQLEYEDQHYEGDNVYSDTFTVINDFGELQRRTWGFSLVTRGISPIKNSSLQQIQWELGYRRDVNSTAHDQTITDETPFHNPEILSVIDTVIDEPVYSFKVGVQIVGGKNGSHYSAYLNQGRSKRLPTLNDYYLLNQLRTPNSSTPGLTPEALSTTEIGFEFGLTSFPGSPQIDELVLIGAVFTNQYSDKIAYKYPENSAPIPYNTELAKISGYEFGLKTSWWNNVFRLQTSYQKLNIDNPIIFPNKPKSRFTLHAEIGYKWIFLGYDQFNEGFQFIVHNGFIGQSYRGRESANLTMILRWKLWKLKTSLHYVIYNIYSDEPVLADAEIHALTPFEYFGVHREILSLKFEL